MEVKISLFVFIVLFGLVFSEITFIQDKRGIMNENVVFAVRVKGKNNSLFPFSFLSFPSKLNLNNYFLTA